MKALISALLLALLAGCATGPRIDHSYSAKAQSPRVKFIVLHYTVSDKPSSIKILTQQQVSAHYLVTDDPETIIYNLVPETQQAWHAGVSSWKGFTNLNTSSVGIEIVNAGWKDTPTGRVYAPFPQYQIDSVIALVRDIAQRYHVPPENVLGHSDIAPGRKQDPGPMFPWKQFADQGLAVWPDATRVASVRPVFDAQQPDVTWFQRKLAAFGYGVTQTCLYDEQTRNALSAFQSKFRPANIDGAPDAETATLLEVLTTPANAPLPVVQASAPLPNAVCACSPSPVIQPAATPAAPALPQPPAVPVPAAVPATPAAPQPLNKQ
ncbi:N-acetylmuramoyl-L-alanine amidase [Massilia solisilvae]|uniref:N-acetylmuramoyl-L-alanine amidase n=1 Tax=Massilia solisilvae TaxID=1811225 RepID=A0ABT2BQ45_9BURK|nr:N-acetylmuramoyl-L-alanine amidase [Massilia solisilvae]MCS0610170.1 N-acetylmuramoyl-L-alanine amidase [Massilia solisilvae]